MSVDHLAQTDHDTLVGLKTVLIGFDGQNGMRGQLKTLEAKHDDLDGKVDCLDTKVDERFQKLFSRIWWIIGVVITCTSAIVAAIIESHPPH